MSRKATGVFESLRRWTDPEPSLILLSKRVIRILGGSVLLMLCLPWVQTAPGSGKVIALSATERRSELSSPVDGRIQKWFVNEGQRVTKGDVLVEISDNDPLILKRLGAERTALQKRLVAAEQGRKTSALNLDRQKILVEQGLSARRTYELAMMELARYESDVASAQAEIARIDVRLSRQEQQKISAPMDGTVVRIHKNAAEGTQFVKTGDLLATLAPLTESRAVEILVRGNDVPLVREGAQVLIQFEGWPTVMFSGWPDLAVGTFRGRVEFVDALDDGHGSFRVVASPWPGERWPGSEYLRQGMRATSWILLGKVSLAFELWRQFNGFPNSYVDKPYGAESKGADSKGTESKGR
jgi:multidrug efflux pump subunit AcrA (membrane-fusion protein)